MLASSSSLDRLGIVKPLVWLFNVTLAIIFLGWWVIDGVIRLLKNCIKKCAALRWQGREADMKNEKIRFRPVLAAGLVAAFVASFSIQAKAGEDIDHIEARKLQDAGEILSFEKIAAVARSHKAGDILETELEKNRKTGLFIYEVEILDAKGMVWELDINAKTGDLIKIEADD